VPSWAIATSIRDTIISYHPHDVYTFLMMSYLMKHSSLHSNAGAQLQAKILLLHPTLHNSQEGDGVDVPNVINVVDGIAESYAGASAAVEDQNSVASSRNQLEASANQLATDPLAALDSSVDSGVDSTTALPNLIVLDRVWNGSALGTRPD
jgi:hypothetical protein